MHQLIYILLYIISWWVYFVTGLDFVLQQPSTAILAKTKADIAEKSSYSYSSRCSHTSISVCFSPFWLKDTLYRNFNFVVVENMKKKKPPKIKDTLAKLPKFSVVPNLPGWKHTKRYQSFSYLLQIFDGKKLPNTVTGLYNSIDIQEAVTTA